MNFRHAILCVAVLCAGTAVSIFAAPLDDLSSPSQKTRSAAAKSLRKAYAAPSIEKWKPFLATLHKGESVAEVEKKLNAVRAVRGAGVSGGGGSTVQYRLDDTWVLDCTFTDPGSQLFNYAARYCPQSVSVAPPEKFTGLWSTYYADGQPFERTIYFLGKIVGGMRFASHTELETLEMPLYNGPDGKEMR